MPNKIYETNSNGRIVQVTEENRKYFSETDIMDAKHKNNRIPRTVQANGSLARTTDHLIHIHNFPDASALTIAMEAKANQ